MAAIPATHPTLSIDRDEPTMLHQHTLDQLRGLRLDGMIAALNDTATQAAAEALPFEQRLALLVQRELDWRDGKRVARLLKNARLKVSSACIEDIDWRAGRGLDRHLATALAEGDWIRRGRNVLITGATGCGKTWLGCALAFFFNDTASTEIYTCIPALSLRGALPICCGRLHKRWCLYGKRSASGHVLRVYLGSAGKLPQ